MSENVKRVMTSPVYVLRGGAYLLDEHAGVLVDSSGNYSAKTKGAPRSLAILLRAIADDIEDDTEQSHETYSVYGGQGLRRIATGLSYAEAERVSRKFEIDCMNAGLTNPPGRIERDR